MASRKSILFLHSVIPVTKTHDDVVREKLKPGKFVFTVTGIIKVLGMLCLLASIAFILGSNICKDYMDYRYLIVISLGISIANCLLFYLIFCLGYTVKNPGLWVKIDIISNLIFPTITIISCILGTYTCKTSGGLDNIAEPLGIIGSIILIISCGALFLLYRYKEEDNTNVPRAIRNEDSRKSIFA